MRPRPTLHGLLPCIECKRQRKPYWHDPSNFYRHTKKADGTHRRDSYCIPCRRAFNDTNRRARYRHDPAYRESEARRHAKRGRGIAKERDGERRARRELAGKIILRLRSDGWTMRLIGIAVGVCHTVVSKWSRQEVTPSSRNLALLRELARQTAGPNG